MISKKYKINRQRKSMQNYPVGKELRVDLHLGKGKL